MSFMQSEILATPSLIPGQLQQNLELWQTFIERYQAYAPHSIMTLARGSSDHAAIFAKYLFETELLLPTSSCAPSVISVYQRPLQLQGVLVLAISQSGQSPDLVEVMHYARRSGALTLALVNDTHSPLAQASEFVIPLHAGPELAVAATKSFLLTLTALIHGVSLLTQNEDLQAALFTLPELLLEVFNFPLLSIRNYCAHPETLILGRGFSFSIAAEMALKFKEVTQIHGEAFSAAEVLHGPLALLSKNLPLLLLTQNDASLPNLVDTLHQIRAAGVEPFVLASKVNAGLFRAIPQLILLPDTHPILTPLLACAFLYLLVESLAKARGLNPDQPPLLRKVTKTR